MSLLNRAESTLMVKTDETTAPLPSDVGEGYWRIDRVHDWLTLLLLKKDLKDFLLLPGASEGVMRRLVIEDMDGEARAALNRLSMIDSVQGEIEGRLKRLCLDPSQRKAVLHALGQRLAVLQGPPGTGKTTVAHALLIILCG